MKIHVAYLLLLLIPFLSKGQINTSPFNRDTTFTVWSAGEKIKKDFPDARAVKEFTHLKIQGERDLIYYSLGNRYLHADVFYPAVTPEVEIPAIILIHGGGWASGSKLHLLPMAQKLAGKGFFAATIEHRLSPEAKYPAAITDLKTAVKWVKLNAQKYHIDTSKIVVLGCSSGATLASLVGTTCGHARFKSHATSESVSDKVYAIINIDGIVDFTDRAESGKDTDPKNPSAGTRWFGFTYQQNPGLWVEASPLTYVDALTPPTLFINSAIPRFHAGRDKYIQVLTQNSIYSEIHTIENTPHPFWLFHPWFDETIPLIVDFINSALF